MILLIISVSISCLYAWLISSLIRSWQKNTAQKYSKDYSPKIGISVVVIARNEEQNIQSCLHSILSNEFPKTQFEIIVVDDHSEDQTIEKIHQIGAENIRVLSLADFIGTKKINAFKKLGIQYALRHAKFDYIMHTDADCLVPTNWIKQTAYNFERGIKLQAGPISFSPIDGFLSWFQQLDMYTLMASTNAGIQSKRWYLANGANIAYQHSSLPENIYDESDLFASGDDVFLINQMANQQAENIYFEKSITVTTSPVDNLSDFISQRIRWAGKNKSLGKGKMKNILLIPVLTNVWLLSLVLLFPINLKLALMSFGIFIISKAMIDYIILQYMHDEFNMKGRIKHFLLAFFCYPFYITGIGIVSLVTKQYVWKSRRVQ